MSGGKPAQFRKPDAGDPVAWLLAYLPKAFPLPFGAVHHEIIEAVTYALEHGGNVAIAAPRGTGKSTLVNGLLLWALLTGRSSFPCVIPWDDRAKRRALRFWAGELCFNKRLERDYRETVIPFVASRGVANRLVALTSGSESTGARLGITEGVIILPGGKGAIGSATINGNPRGLNYATIDGRIVRPSFVVVDDPQDRKTAKSLARVQDTIERIDSDVAGMAGPDTRMPIVMPCTVIERDDVAEHYLRSPDWRAIRVGQITAWPDGWDKSNSPARKAWEEWNTVRQEGDHAQDGGESAVAYYLSNREVLTAGMEVSWVERYDRKRGQPDALYSAMFDYHVMGESAFASERQNAPLEEGAGTLPFKLTPEIVCSRQAERKPYEVPGWVSFTVASTDINPSYALTTTIVGFGRDQTAGVLYYGTYPMFVSGDNTATDRAKQVFEALVENGRQLVALPCKTDVWAIDANGTDFDAVLRFCARASVECGIPAQGFTGQGARNYKPFGKTVDGRPAEQCHRAIDMASRPPRKWIKWNADYWREVAQRAWLGTVGAPGSLSLFKGTHTEFAEQICRERLMGKGEIGGAMMWNWYTQPGKHDYGDTLSQAYAAAAWGGIGTGGQVIRRKYTETRKCKAPIQ